MGEKIKQKIAMSVEDAGRAIFKHLEREGKLKPFGGTVNIAMRLIPPDTVLIDLEGEESKDKKAWQELQRVLDEIRLDLTSEGK